MQKQRQNYIDIMDAAFTTIGYFHAERRMLNSADGSCQWGKAFPLAGFDGAASLQHCKASGALGLHERKAAGYFYLALLTISQKDKPS